MMNRKPHTEKASGGEGLREVDWVSAFVDRDIGSSSFDVAHTQRQEIQARRRKGALGPLIDRGTSPSMHGACSFANTVS